MLQTQTVEPGTFSLLKELMDIPKLNAFALVGGTALSLKFGHRTSVDLDLFSLEKFVPEEIEAMLLRRYENSFSAENRRSQPGPSLF